MGRMQGVLDFWERLKAVKSFTLHAESHAKEETGWNRLGSGEVVVSQENENVILFQEKGTWQMPESMAFSNVFRWTLDRTEGRVSLEHLRRGPTHPVFLFDLVAVGSYHLASVDAHLCGEDVYQAQVVWDSESIRLSWRVMGPKKNEEVECLYKRGE